MSTESVFNNAVDPFNKLEDVEKRFYLTRNALEWWSTKDFNVRSLNTRFTTSNDRYINGKIYNQSINFAFEGRPTGFVHNHDNNDNSLSLSSSDEKEEEYVGLFSNGDTIESSSSSDDNSQ